MRRKTSSRKKIIKIYRSICSIYFIHTSERSAATAETTLNLSFSNIICIYIYILYVYITFLLALSSLAHQNFSLFQFSVVQPKKGKKNMIGLISRTTFARLLQKKNLFFFLRTNNTIAQLNNFNK